MPDSPVYLIKQRELIVKPTSVLCKIDRASSLNGL
jgi:hypothetical protein